MILCSIIFAVVEFCKAEPCLNGGTCKETPLGYSCLCRSRFRGQNCDGKYTWCIETKQKEKIYCVLEEKTFRRIVQPLKQGRPTLFAYFSNLNISGANADICKRKTAFLLLHGILCDTLKKLRDKNL